MKTEKIIHGNSTLAVLVRDADWEDGLNFISSEPDYEQIGLWQYKRGTKLAAHTHLIAKREILRTQEVVYIKSGSMKADLFTENGVFVKTVVLNTGDFLFLMAGGHGYEILEDKTQVLEVKNGPYPGAENDRKRL